MFLSFARRWAEPPEPALGPEATCGLIVARAFVVMEWKGVGVKVRARTPPAAGRTGCARPRAAAGSEAEGRNARSICMGLERGNEKSGARGVRASEGRGPTI